MDELDHFSIFIDHLCLLCYKWFVHVLCSGCLAGFVFNNAKIDHVEFKNFGLKSNFTLLLLENSNDYILCPSL